MGKVIKKVQGWTEGVNKSYTNSATNKVIGNITSVAKDVSSLAGGAVVFALSKAWIGIGTLKPAKTNKDDKFIKLPNPFKSVGGRPKVDPLQYNSAEHTIDRFDTEAMWAMKLGDFYMPISQTFSLRAKKRLNVSQLVDGIDIIQQTRKEAKIIDCTLRISLIKDDNVQKNIKIVDEYNNVQYLAQLLFELYEVDAVFKVVNETINQTFGVEYVMMSDYKFTPKTGMHTYSFEFTLTEVKYGENVLTLSLNQIVDGKK